ncbi:MAG: ATP cone domain-containing protein, partial [Sorangiineae bacterium]|nr:ATP cone domain-containing protein [Sorangiineae bacterium]
MRCPYCGDDANRVVDSRLGRDEAEIRRRRECLECGRRFTTRERVEDVLPKLVKRDERREDFDRRKLLASVEKACAKRPVSIDALERLADRIEKRLQETGRAEVASE